MEEYRKAKALLFSISKKGVINLDDAAAEKMLADAKCPCMTFSCGKPEADLEATDLQLHADGVEFTAQYQGEKADVKLADSGSFLGRECTDRARHRAAARHAACGCGAVHGNRNRRQGPC